MTYSRSFSLLCLVFLAPACGPSTATPDTADDVPLVADGGDVPSDVPSDEPSDAPTGDVPSDALHGSCESMPVSDVASRQTVTFHFASTASGYLVTEGLNCGAMSISRIDGVSETPLTLGLSFQCICECPRPPDPMASHARAFGASAGAPTLVWDARALSTCTSVVDCSERGFQAAQLETESAAAPVQAGHYRATFAVFDTLPPNCNEASDGTVSCAMSFNGNPATSYGLCPAMRMVQVEFDLPPDGDLDVNVP
jgi:hypothetical protein